MSLWAIVAIAIATIALALVVRIPPRKKVCPACHQRTLEESGHIVACGAGTGFSLKSYRCTSCASEWRDYNGAGLITREAYEAGAREPIPTARVQAP